MKKMSILFNWLQRPGFSHSIKEIEGLRFLAIFLVMLQHFNERFIRYGKIQLEPHSLEANISHWISRGTIGVFIFFSISGFILSQAWMNGLNLNKESYWKYLKKRINRLEIPYLFWMSIFAIALFFQSDLAPAAMFKHYLASSLYLHNVIYQAYSIINPVAWSLEVEFQFYLLAPFLVWIFLKVQAQYRSVFFIILMFVLSVLQNHFGAWHFPLKATLLGQLQYFLIGMFFAFQAHSSKTTSRSFRYDILFVLSLILLAQLWSADWFKNIMFWCFLYALLYSAFHSVFINKILKKNAVVLIGGMCYSLYLTHLPLFELIFKLIIPTRALMFQALPYLGILLLVLSVVITLGAISFMFIEKPFMYMPARNPFPDLRNSIKLRKISKALAISSVFLAAALIPSFSYAESEDKGKAFKLKPLAELLDTVLDNNPRITRYNELINVNEERVKITNNSWLSSIALTGSALYGTGTLVDNTFNSDLTVTEQAVRLQTTNNSFYNAGISFRLPLSTIFNTGHERNVLKFQSRALEKEREAMQLLIREELITKYYDVINAYDKLTVATEALEANRMKLEVSEKFYSEGKLDIGLYKSDLDNFYLSKSHKVDCESDFLSKYYALKNFVGSEIEQK